MTPPIEVLTVNHDAKPFIELCIRAVHLRTRQPFRHVVIDNGSRPDVLEMLQKFVDAGWITLVRRRLPKHAGSHAASLDWWLRQPNRGGLYCLLDSDAYPVAQDWLGLLWARLGSAGAVGCAHFRDESLLHPACLLFQYAAYAQAGRPSFAIHRKDGKFMDTGMLVCEKMRAAGLVPLERTKEIEQFVRHRWSGTRVEIAPNGVLDGLMPRAVHDAESMRFLAHPSVVEALQHKGD